MAATSVMRIAVTVTGLRDEAPDVKSFELRQSDGSPLPAFTAGSHLDVHMASGTIRQYSLCNAPHERDRYLIAVKREAESRGGSRFMHDAVKPGDALTISPPRNNFALDETASHHLLLAGGIGITPLLGMARHLVAVGGSFELHYFARSRPEETAFRAELAGQGLGQAVRFHHELSPAETSARLAEILRLRPPGAHLYTCGPVPFMETVTAAAQPHWPAAALHREFFAAPAVEPRDNDGSFTVRLASSGKDYPVGPGQTIVAALAAHRIFIETSCGQGICGTCMTGVVEGEPDHRDSFLSEEERGYGDRILACVSRCRSDVLVLDL
jgi:vanillate O-demethylase ferredoxin subunit